MKLYIAGPMTGMKDWNFPLFFETETKLKALGHDVINPAAFDGKTLKEALENTGSADSPAYPWSFYIRRDLPWLFTVDAVVVLPGWQKSKGATIETQVAQALGAPLLVLKNGRLIPRVTAIGLSGYAQAGKDTLGQYLWQNHAYTAVAFAEPMREAMRRLNPTVEINGNHISYVHALEHFGYEDLKKVAGDVRPLMQRLGTEVGRNMFGENFWVDLALKHIPDGSKVVFTDVRFPNEAQAVKSLGGEVWRISRPGTEPANAHISETALDDYKFDAVLVNDTKASLFSQANSLLEATK